MAPAACVLLDRTVAFRSHPQETEPFDLGEKIEKGVVTIGASTSTAELLVSREATEASIATYLLHMTPDLEEVVEPPEVSRLTMQRPLASAPIANHGWQLRDGAVAAAADKNLVVLSSGSYRPAYSYNRWYLLLDLDAADDDASASCLSSIPAIHYEYADSYSSADYGTVIMTTTREGGGGGASFVLAELLWDFHRRGGLPALGMLCVWQSWLCSWVYKRGELPAEVLQTWRIHMSFPVQTRSRRLFY